MADLKDLEDKIEKFRSRGKAESDKQKEEQAMADRSTGMRAGSEFISYVFAGAVVGWLLGTFLGHLALWLIVMMFAGFGLGIYRAAQIMK